jgi:ABC-2 type transport system permease protein
MQILILIKNQLKLLFSSRVSIFAIIAAPLLLTYLFSFSSNGGKTNLYINDSDNSAYSNELITMLKSHTDINVISLTKKKLEKKLDDNSISIGFIINKNFEEDLIADGNLNMKILQNYETSDGALLKQTVLGDVNTLKKITIDSKVISKGLNLSNDHISKELLQKINSASNISINDRTVSNDEKMQSSATTKLIGFLIMFIWFIVVQGFRTLIQEKENGTFNRIVSTPTNYNKYLISKIASTYIFGLIIITVILTAGKYIFNINLASNMVDESIIFAVYLFAITGIVMIFVPFIKKQQSFTIFGGIIMTLTGILGGSFFSIDEISSTTMQLISKFTPESWAIKAISDITLNNADINSEMISLVMLSAIGVLGLATSYILLNVKINAAKA